MSKGDIQEYSEYAIQSLARQFAECIAPFMDVRYSYDPYMMRGTLSARIKIVEPVNKLTEALSELYVAQGRK